MAMRDPNDRYRAVHTDAGGVVLLRFDIAHGREQQVLPEASLKLRDHSPTGFEMGFMGPGSSQLALAILLDFTGDAVKALLRYQVFKRQHVARWTNRQAAITGQQLIDFLAAEEFIDQTMDRL